MTIYGIEEEHNLPYHDSEVYIRNKLYRTREEAEEEIDELNKTKSEHTSYSVREFELDD